MSGATSTSVRDDLKELLQDVLRLVRAELAVVRAGGMRIAKRGAIALGLVMAAALALLLTLIFLLGAAAQEISSALGNPWLGWLCIAGFTLIVAAVLGFVGYRSVRRAIADGKRVGATVKEDLEWLRELPRQSAKGS